MNVTRTTNPNGTHRYEIDGEIQYKASKVVYTHVSSYTNGAVLFHKTEAAARKATGYTGWTKAGYQAIEDGDAAATVAQHALTIANLAAVLMEQGRLRVSTRLSSAAITTTLDIARGREATRAAGIALAHGHDRDIREAFKTSVPPAMAPVDEPQAPAPRRARVIDQWESYEGATYAYDVDGNRVIEISAKTRPNRWNGHMRSNVRSWAVIRNGVAASGTANGLREAKSAALSALAQLDGVTVADILPPRKGAKVRVNTEYPGQAYKGITGRVHSIVTGDDGVRYVMVDFRGVTWPFQIHELDVI